MYTLLALGGCGYLNKVQLRRENLALTAYIILEEQNDPRC